VIRCQNHALKIDRKEREVKERGNTFFNQSFQIDSGETLQSQTFSQSLSATTPSILSNGLASYNSFYVLLLYTIRFVVRFRLPELLRGQVAVRVRRPPSLLPPGQGNSRRRGAPGERECRILRGYGKPRPHDSGPPPRRQQRSVIAAHFLRWKRHLSPRPFGTVRPF
jgi:hypothetical protein